MWQIRIQMLDCFEKFGNNLINVNYNSIGSKMTLALKNSLLHKCSLRTKTSLIETNMGSINKLHMHHTTNLMLKMADDVLTNNSENPVYVECRENLLLYLTLLRSVLGSYIQNQPQYFLKYLKSQY